MPIFIRDPLEGATATFLHLVREQQDAAAWQLVSTGSQRLATAAQPDGEPWTFLGDRLRKGWAPILRTEPATAPTRYADERHAWVWVVIEAGPDGFIVDAPTRVPAITVEWLLEDGRGWTVDCYRMPGDLGWAPRPSAFRQMKRHPRRRHPKLRRSG